MAIKKSRSSELVKEDSKVIAKCNRIPYYPLAFEKGRGAILEDIDGKEYIDFLSSAGATNLGHCHPYVVNAIKEQAENLIHYTPAYVYSEPLVKLAKELIEITPGQHKKRVMFGLTGSDANDGLIKAARAYTGRSKIICFQKAYHGSTYGSITLSNLSLNMRRKIGPFVPDIYSFPYPECYRCKYKKTAECCNLECMYEMEEAFRHYLPPEEVAAVLMEPIAGDAGLIVPPKKYFDRLYEICRKFGILFTVDEVQQGFGRTGKWFSIENFGIVPDIMALAKSIASGMPLSAVVARAEILDSLEPPAHLFTTGGNPVCCAAASATIKGIKDEKLMERAVELGEYITSRFVEMQKRFEIIGEVRGIGLSIGVDLVKDRETRERNNDAALRICYRSLQKGLVLIFIANNVLRIQPPLVITQEEAERGLGIIEESIEEYVAGKIPDSVLDTIKGW